MRALPSNLFSFDREDVYGMIDRWIDRHVISLVFSKHSARLVRCRRQPRLASPCLALTCLGLILSCLLVFFFLFFFLSYLILSCLALV